MSALDELVGEVTADPESIGLILHGSRAAGVHELYDGAERRPAPFHDQLSAPLRELEREQGWEEEYLAETLTRVLATGDPTLQQELELRVEALVDGRGVAHQWSPEEGLGDVKEHRFR